MKHRTTIVAALIALLSGCATGPQQSATAGLPSTSPEVPASVKQPLPQEPPALLWVVEGDHGRMYLFGTMHYGVTLEQLPESVGTALGESEVLILESNPNGADPQLLAEMMMLEEGPGLDEHLGEERWDRLLNLVGDQFRPRVARRVQPWVLEAALLQEIMPQSEPMELGLLDLARENELEIGYLEDWQTQIQLLNNASSPAMLAEIVDDPDAFRERTHAMSRDYIVGDIDALREHIFGSEYSSVELFDERNAVWLPTLTDYAQRGDVFVAIGAGHLIGTGGLLDLLAERGYQVRRVD